MTWSCFDLESSQVESSHDISEIYFSHLDAKVIIINNSRVE